MTEQRQPGSRHERAGGTAAKKTTMTTEILVPTLGESVASATVARWLKKAGEAVAADEPLVELETDKVTVEVNAPSAGVIESIAADEGAEVAPGAVLGTIAPPAPRDAAASRRPGTAAAPTPPPTPAPATPPGRSRRWRSRAAPSGPVAVAGHRWRACAAARRGQADGREAASPPSRSAPAAAKDGRITKGDVLDFLAARARGAAAAAPSRGTRPARLEEGEERVKMTRLRLTIAAPAEGGAEHRRHADHLQRGGHGRGDGAAHRVPRRLREEARRAARLHVASS